MLYLWLNIASQPTFQCLGSQMTAMQPSNLDPNSSGKLSAKVLIGSGENSRSHFLKTRSMWQWLSKMFRHLAEFGSRLTPEPTDKLGAVDTWEHYLKHFWSALIVFALWSHNGCTLNTILPMSGKTIYSWHDVDQLYSFRLFKYVYIKSKNVLNNLCLFWVTTVKGCNILMIIRPVRIWGHAEMRDLDKLYKTF